MGRIPLFGSPFGGRGLSRRTSGRRRRGAGQKRVASLEKGKRKRGTHKRSPLRALLVTFRAIFGQTSNNMIAQKRVRKGYRTGVGRTNGYLKVTKRRRQVSRVLHLEHETTHVWFGSPFAVPLFGASEGGPGPGPGSSSARRRVTEGAG